ncbi:hypothetical protein HPOKI154_03275 [Helicobacter pylori oki154]|nr:hypothetical protein HPOKI154_03275 [Helicobacter pylori oki154]AHN44150.1 hypothetical protein HPOKI828_03265 [Helicobacter pylori oki828]
MEGKTEEEVTKIMEQYINEALGINYFLKELKSFESVMVLIFEDTVDSFPEVIL